MLATLLIRQSIEKPVIRGLTHSIRSYSTSVTQIYRPLGFKASAVECGIKKRGGLDMVLISSETPCTAAAVFTTNKVCAAPVLVDQELLSTNKHQGIQSVVINSGCANAVTGEEGMKNAREMSSMAAKALSQPKNAFVMSTGVIGVQLDMNKIKNGITKASQSLTDSEEAWQKAAKGIMTTDTRPKLSSHQIPKKSINFIGISKGAGMIHPNMATMLSVVCTDAKVSVPCLNQAMKYVADRSFNSITIDGDTSTNDTFLVLANGRSSSSEISDPKSQEFREFQDGLLRIAVDLSKMIVRDGEGATKFVTIIVRGAKSMESAKQVASSIAKSSLVKTAIAGQDANWGRVLAAVGYSGVEVIPERISLWFTKGEFGVNPKDSTEGDNGVMKLLHKGTPVPFDEARALALLKNTDISIIVDLGLGEETATMWTCDLTEDYIKINASYRS